MPAICKTYDAPLKKNGHFEKSLKKVSWDNEVIGWDLWMLVEKEQREKTGLGPREDHRPEVSNGTTLITKV